MAEWPQRISAQILRTRLAAFKQELCDYKFAQNPCASCCRLKRRCKLFDVVFPPADAQRPPEWLPWTEEEWLKHRKQWYESVDDILNINQYLERFFHVSGRLSAARMAVATFENDTGASPSFPSLAAAESWERRVQQWCENLRRDLHGDSLEAPGRSDQKWLLFSSEEVSIESGTGAISCQLCKKCRDAFAKVRATDRRPDVRMPEMARANGMWLGPEPEELRVLSYCENKVINLARAYVSVKRVFLNCSSYARTSHSEAPLYHQRNVVAYPQNADAALRAIGMDPDNLARTLQVQFVGEGRHEIRKHPDLQVSVDKLRPAFRWLSLNSWPFM